MEPMLLIYTRADPAVGHGHAVRALALAEAARRRGVTVRFAVDDLTAAVLRGYGLPAAELGPPTTAQWVIRDLPGGSDAAAVAAERAAGSRVLLIDDHGPARCHATWNSDAMLTPARAAKLPHPTEVGSLYGLAYVPLRIEVARYVGHAVPGRGQRLLIALGGGFAPELPTTLLTALANAGLTGECQLLLPGPAADPALPAAARRLRVTPVWGVSDVGARLAQADLVITKLGITLLEALAVGVGALLLEPGPSHLQVATALAEHYPSLPVEEMGCVDPAAIERLAQRAVTLLAQPERLARWGAQGRALVDGGGATRLVEVLLGP